ncbi:MAG: flagellar basal body rod protein FlgC [Actinobacteria bacterium]|nr:MAG: flagellar basal body rod protein FlgC [Actinomycetota bacterium]
MGLFDALGISGSGLSAQRLRMDVTAENLANAQSIGYKRKDVVLRETGNNGFGGVLRGAMAGSPAGSGVEVQQIATDPTQGRRVYDPGNPAADARGYVTMPNVNPVTEMVDLIDASRAYEANVTAMQAAKQMFSKTLDLLR